MPAPADLKERIGESKKASSNGGSSPVHNKDPLNLPPMPVTFSAAALREMDFPEPAWLVPGIIPEGVTLIGGKPKVGKSFLALDLGLALSLGGKAFGKIDVEPTGVLYLSLEDRKRRLQDRIHSLLPEGTWPENFHMTVEWPRMDHGAIPLLSKWVESHPGVKVIIVDTLAKIKPGKASTKPLYDSDYQTMDALKTFPDTHGISLLILHHLRKMEADDPFDTLSGSTGLTGAVDTGIILKKEHGKGMLYVRGRDVEEQELLLDRDVSGAWILLGNADQFRRSQEQQAVLDILRDSDENMTLSKIAELAGKRTTAVYNLIKALAADGLVVKMGYGKYKIKNESTESSESSESSESLSRSRQKNKDSLLFSPRSESLKPYPSTVSGQDSLDSLDSLVCAECSFFVVDGRPNLPGHCTGKSHDGERKQFPKLPHSCAGFVARPGKVYA